MKQNSDIAPMVMTILITRFRRSSKCSQKFSLLTKLESPYLIMKKLDGDISN